ncbi:MAG TPA: hypothetical protein VFY34_11645 [Pyrinomonadaceae bacterium]|nr:hypothetical protein [Pyrinomonadaceae bacterium]
MDGFSVNQRLFRIPTLSTAGDNSRSPKNSTLYRHEAALSPLLGQPQLSTAGYKLTSQTKQNRDWTTGTPVVNVLFVARQHASHH